MSLRPAVAVVFLLLTACGETMVPPPSCAESCQGCCTADGRCEAGGTSAACGLSGRACQACGGDQACAAGTCFGGSRPDAGAGSDAGTDACAAVTCRTPPASTCVDAQTLQVFDAIGTCTSGQCRYQSRTETCQGGCASGRCAADPCQGVTCQTPPAALCRDASTLRTFQTSGTCTAGACQYQPVDVACPSGCLDGLCRADPCLGVTCATPPATACRDASTLRTFPSAGTCAAGGCSYQPTDVACPFGCANGACAGDPCLGVSCVTPPATTCRDASTLRTFTSPGTCGGGTCSYASQDTACPFGCVNGACAGDPCLGLTCATPPAATCVNGTTRRTFTAPGTCTAGVCTYAPLETPCGTSEVCQTGRCAWDDARLSVCR